MKKTTALFALCALVFAGCGDKNKTHIKGERVAILMDDSAAIVQESGGDVHLPNVQHNANWATKARQTSHVMGHLALASDELRLKRSFSTGYGSWRHLQALAEPRIQNGVMYTFDTMFRVKAFDIKRGKKLWTRALPLKDKYEFTGNGGMTVQGDVLYIATGDAQLYALSLLKGDILWEARLAAPAHAAPTVGYGKIFINTINAEMQVFDLSGALLWSYSGLAESAALSGASSPVLSGGVVLTGFASGDLAALRQDNGQPLWEASLGQTRKTDAVTAIAAIKASPIVENGVVYAVSHSGVLGAYEIASGQKLFTARISADQTPVLAGGYLFIVGDNGKLYCLDKKTGDTVYERKLLAKNDKDVVWFGPCLAMGKLYLTNSLGELWTMDAKTGQKIKSQNVASAFYQAPIIADGQLFVLSHNGTLYTFG